MIQAAGAFCWLMFGLAIMSWPQIISNVCWLFAVTVLAFALARDRQRPRWHFLALVGLIGLSAYASSLVDEDLPGWLGGFFVLVVSVPQLVHTLRNPRAQGASLGSWVFFTASACAWLAYGLTLGRLNMVATAIPQALLAFLVVIALLWTRGMRATAPDGLPDAPKDDLPLVDFPLTDDLRKGV
jgi:uncharacterized protein with PQ loop repeat